MREDHPELDEAEIVDRERRDRVLLSDTGFCDGRALRVTPM